MLERCFSKTINFIQYKHFISWTDFSYGIFYSEVQNIFNSTNDMVFIIEVSKY